MIESPNIFVKEETKWQAQVFERKKERKRVRSLCAKEKGGRGEWLCAKPSQSKR